MHFCHEKTQNTVKKLEYSKSTSKSTIFADFSLFSKSFHDTITKGDINL